MLLHLAWRRNLDGFDLALAANRVAARGTPLWWLGASGPAHEAGDYLCDVDDRTAARITDFGIVAERWTQGLPDGAVAIAHPRIALLASTASAYPNFAYYAMALARLGFDFDLVDGAAMAQGALDDYDLVVLPTGCATWGLDAAEGVTGADAAFREFLAGRGAAIGSGGGSFYLSSGRPGWSGVASVRPVHTHEFLRTGVGIVSVRFDPDSIAFGCPPTLEMPYYHGPIYAELDRSTWAAADFDRLVMPGHLFVANPLDAGVFAREMRGHAAILRAETRRGRAMLFSPNPEMGDLVRKYTALDQYVARYLPIGGEAAMADTMRHYRPLESPSWRLILNAVHSLMLREQPPGIAPGAPVPQQPPEPKVRLPAAIAEAAKRLSVPADAPLAGLAESLRDDIGERVEAVGKRVEAVESAFAALNPPAPGIRYLWSGCEAAALAALGEDRGPAQSIAERLAEIETPLVLAEAWCRLGEGERHFGRMDGIG
jgi:hypothetical protein